MGAYINTLGSLRTTRKGRGTMMFEVRESQTTLEIEQLLEVQSLPHLLVQRFHQLRNLLFVPYYP
jgi:hypothetical protein